MISAISPVTEDKVKSKIPKKNQNLVYPDTLVNSASSNTNYLIKKSAEDSINRGNIADSLNNTRLGTDAKLKGKITSSPSAVVGPDTLMGSILPRKRIIAFYGNPLSKRMGILGELPSNEMLAKLDKEVANWEKADPKTPVQPALHVIAVTAQNEPGNSGKYRLRMANSVIDTVLALAQKRNALVFLDIQAGQSTLQEELPVLETYLKLPNVHLGIDAEFALKQNRIPGRHIGSFDAEDINYATQYLADLAQQHQIPPKLLIVHRFTQAMITNYKKIKLNPYCQIVMHMDGWGSPAIKRWSYQKYIKGEPVQYTGLKIFYKNDIKRKGWRLMNPKEILTLSPKPYYIQYQ
ncbi:hypothetical protein [Adhaeribacter radiodurans]|uniref:Lipoprotein n=1 Tax=Adhaeribacter radiodurans TaxID=2745197 RepID=A0A7L7L598_9BACT|nr:hypothetical protein [Adhaeribacter radiodurans]QMU27977.1 hypothetical protein HUW48_07915 [Adhaeribacter radiodurans]